MSLLEFASDSPFLTFFLVVIILSGLIDLVKAWRKK